MKQQQKKKERFDGSEKSMRDLEASLAGMRSAEILRGGWTSTE